MKLSLMTCAGVFLAVGTALICGCGEEKKDTTPRVSLKGRLTEKGKPWTFDDSKIKYPKGVSAPPLASGANGSPIQIKFIPADAPGDIVTALVNAQAGTFDVTGIKPGKYKIAVFLTSSLPSSSDPLGGKFTLDKTQIVRDIAGGEDLEIDVSKPKG